MNTRTKVLRKAILIFFAAALLFAGGFVVGAMRNDVEPQPVTPSEDFELPFVIEKRVITIDEIEAKLSEISELATYSADYSVERTEEHARYLLDDIKIIGTTNAISLKCRGVVKVGYSVNDIIPKVDNKSFKIYVALPEPMLLDNYIIWDSVDCDEQNSILNPIDFGQYKTMITDIEAEGLAQAEEKGVYRLAEEHMKMIINNFLAEFSDYEVVFM